jgi:hypothetical protein
MTSPNEWWKEEPYRTEKSETKILMTKSGSFYADILDEHFDIPAIIEEVKRMERGETTVNITITLYECLNCHGTWGEGKFQHCPHCGLKINWE